MANAWLPPAVTITCNHREGDGGYARLARVPPLLQLSPQVCNGDLAACVALSGQAYARRGGDNAKKCRNTPLYVGNKRFATEPALACLAAAAPIAMFRKRRLPRARKGQ